MGGRFVDCCLLVPLPTISRKNSRVENELVCIVDHLLGGVGRGAGVGVRDCVINLPSDDLDGVDRGLCVTKALVFYKPVSVGDYVVGLVEVGEQIQNSGSAIPLVRPVF